VIHPSLQTGEIERLLYLNNIYVNKGFSVGCCEIWIVLLDRYSVGVTLQAFLKTRQKYAGSL
jgi:hypothetical protein